MKSLENKGFSDDFNGIRKYSICLNLLNIGSEIWWKSFTKSVRYTSENLDLIYADNFQQNLFVLLFLTLPQLSDFYEMLIILWGILETGREEGVLFCIFAI